MAKPREMPGGALRALTSDECRDGPADIEMTSRTTGSESTAGYQHLPHRAPAPSRLQHSTFRY
jgi:hypothetical protein